MNFDSLDLSILKTLISDKKRSIEFVNDHDHKLFSPEVWNFAQIITSFVRNFKELPTLRVLSEKLSKNEQQVKHITQVWSELEKIDPDPKEFFHDLEKLKKRFAEKQLAAITETLGKLTPGSIDISKTLSEMQKTIQTIHSLDQYKVYENKNIKDLLAPFVEKFNAKKDNPNLDRGLMTGYSFIDYATNGMKPADFMIIAGESGFGKSLLLNNIAIQVWMQGNKTSDTEFKPGKNVAYISLEMPVEDCFNRLLGRLSGVPIRNIENAKLSREEHKKLKESLDFIKNFPNQFRIIDVPEGSANDIETLILNTGEKFDAIFIDYLGIMETNDKSDEADWQKQGEISKQVRAIGRKLGIPIFSAVQLNRNKTTGKDPAENIGLHRLARSGGIATHATHILQIESRMKEELFPDLVVHFIKNRKGPKNKGILIKSLSSATLIDKVDESLAKELEAGESNEFDDQFTDIDDISEEMERLELS